MMHDVRTSDDKGDLGERGFRTLVENSPDMISRLDGQCRFLYANPAAMRALGRASVAGFAPAGASGKTYRELGLPEDIAATSEACIRRVFETGEEQVFEISLAGHDGIHHYLARAVPELAAEGGIESALLIHRDITERTRTEEALRQSEEKHRFLAENSTDVIWQMDARFRFTFVSSSVEQLLGAVKAEVEGRPPVGVRAAGGAHGH